MVIVIDTNLNIWVNLDPFPHLWQLQSNQQNAQYNQDQDGSGAVVEVKGTLNYHKYQRSKIIGNTLHKKFDWFVKFLEHLLSHTVSYIFYVIIL